MAFQQQVRMPAAQVAGLSREDLALALAYEVEPISGIPADAADVTFADVPEADATVRVFDVTVRRRADAARQSGGVRSVRLAYVAALLLLLAVAGDAAYLIVQRRSLAQEARVRRPLDAELQQLRRSAAAVRAETAAMRAHRLAVVQAQENVARLRAAHAKMLRVLASAFRNKAVLRTLSAAEAPHALAVEAVAMSSADAAEVVREVTQRAADCGWQLQLGAIAAQTSFVSFNFTITPQP